MSKLPVRRDQLRHHLVAFMKWLNENGAEVGTPTNQYEVIRYRAYWRSTRTAGVHIIYAKESGLLTWTGGSLGHFRAFLAGEAMEGARPAEKAVSAPVEAVESQNAKRRKKLLERDGDECWFCGDPMGADMTIEHLVSKARGGGNRLDNFALAHSRCNNEAADKPLVVKIEMRTRMRAARKETAA